MIIDSTALTTFQACPSKFQLRHEVGWKPRRESAALLFGGAIHQGLAAWYKTGSEVEALVAIDTAWNDLAPIDDYRSKAKCLSVMREYIRRYPAENFIIKMIEVPFLLDFGEDYLLEDGDHIEYGGIFDGAIEFGGQTFTLEHKSTSMMGGMYFNQFRPNNQISGYVWATQSLSGDRISGALVNAIGVYAKGETKFERQIISRTDEELIEWKRNVHGVCNEIKRAQKSGFWEMRTVNCTMYGKCDFLPIHQLGHEKERQRLLEQDYVVDKWDFQRQDR